MNETFTKYLEWCKLNNLEAKYFTTLQKYMKEVGGVNVQSSL